MKRIDFERMGSIDGGGAGGTCFAAGLLAVASIGNPTTWFVTYKIWPVVEYCWNT